MGQASTKPLSVCRGLSWQLSTTTSNLFPSADEVEAVLLSLEHTVALGKDVCRIIAGYSRCLIDEAFIASSGLVFPLSSSSLSPPIPIRPPLPSPASCCVALPPSCIAFGLNDSVPKAQTDRRRAMIRLYSAHSFTLSHTLYFPYQSEFLSPRPSVSSMLLLPPPPSSSLASPPASSSLLAGADDVGHVCVWHWPSGSMLYLFHSKPPVFYALSSLCALPYGRLALLLSGCPGPQLPASRLHVFDLLNDRTYRSAVDTEQHAEQHFPRTLFFPPPAAAALSPATASAPASAAKAKTSPYSLYSNDSLFRWHVNQQQEHVEVQPVLLPPLPSPSSTTSPSASFSPPLPSFLSTSSTSWQPLGHSNPLNSYRWKHRCECMRWDAQGRVVRVEGGVGVVRVWVGHHTDRQYTGYFDFVHCGRDHEDEEKDAAVTATTTDEDDDDDRKQSPSHADRLSTSSSSSSSTSSSSSMTSASHQPMDDERKAPGTPTTRPTPPILIPAVPPPFPLLMFHRRPRHRRSPPNLHVSAAFTASGVLVISAHPPEQGGVVRGRVVSGWRLRREREGDAVKGECVFAKRMKDADDIGAILVADAPSKIAQRMKGAKQFFLG